MIWVKIGVRMQILDFYGIILGLWSHLGSSPEFWTLLQRLDQHYLNNVLTLTVLAGGLRLVNTSWNSSLNMPRPLGLRTSSGLKTLPCQAGLLCQHRRQPDEMTVSRKFSTTKGRREGETCILSTSLESKADMPNLLHSAFSCCAMVVRGTNIEVVEPGVK